jgi:hypothetical protein
MFVAVTSHYDVVLYIPVYYEGKIIDVKNGPRAHRTHNKLRKYLHGIKGNFLGNIFIDVL